MSTFTDTTFTGAIAPDETAAPSDHIAETATALLDAMRKEVARHNYQSLPDVARALEAVGNYVKACRNY